MERATSVEDYLARHDGDRRVLLDELRTLAGTTVPAAQEALKWGHPAWLHRSGTILFVVSAHAKHVNVGFTPSTREAFDDELDELAHTSAVETGKGTVKLRYGEPVPRELLGRMMAYRVREHEDDGVGWM